MGKYLQPDDPPIIVPSEELGVAVVWHGSVTFNVHQWQEGERSGYLGLEVDVFTAYGAEQEQPTLALAYSHILDWFEAMEQDMRESWFDHQEPPMREEE